MATEEAKPKKRRRRLRRALFVLFAAGIIYVGAGLWTGMRVLRIRLVEVFLPGLPAELDGLKIAQISDIHYVGPAKVHEKLAEAVEEQAPDLVVFTGDFVESADQVEPCAELVGRLSAGRAAHAVSGNWEHWSHAQEAMTAALEAEGVAVLDNRHIVFERNGARLYLAGVDDPHTNSDDLEAALAGVPEGAPVVLLAHSPDIIEEAAARKVPLVLAGHTHGGQIRLPGRPLVAPRIRRGDLVAGLYREKDTWIYVNTGVGASVVRLRFYCPSELTVFTLRRAKEQPDP